MLRLTFLGTGTSQGVPMVACPCRVCRSDNPRDKRLRSSVMIESERTRIIIDAGPDFRYQMLREGVTNIDAILLTHEHKDHTGGIDDVRAFNYFQSRPVDIFATERVGHVVRKDFDYAFSEIRYPGVPEINLHTIKPGCPFRVGELDIVPVSGLHYRLPVTGFRIGRMAYLTDFNRIEDSEIDKLRGLEVLVLNALRHEKHLSHFNVEQAVEVARRVGATQTWFTHMSHQIGLYTEIHDELPAGIHYAYDGLKIEIA